MIEFVSRVANFFIGRAGVVRSLGDIRWIESQTEQYFNTPIQSLEADAQYLKSIASEAGKRASHIAAIYQSLGKIEEAKLDANTAGIAALSSVQTKRLAYQGKKRKLLEAARKKGG